MIRESKQLWWKHFFSFSIRVYDQSSHIFSCNIEKLFINLIFTQLTEQYCTEILICYKSGNFELLHMTPLSLWVIGWYPHLSPNFSNSKLKNSFELYNKWRLQASWTIRNASFSITSLQSGDWHLLRCKASWKSVEQFKSWRLSTSSMFKMAVVIAAIFDFVEPSYWTKLLIG